MKMTPRNGLDRCSCGCKYWSLYQPLGWHCIDCGDRFKITQQKEEPMTTHGKCALCYHEQPLDQLVHIEEHDYEPAYLCCEDEAACESRIAAEYE